MGTKSRKYFFTHWSLEDLSDRIKELEPEYAFFGEHDGLKSGKRHIHGFVYFRNARGWKSVQDILKVSDLETAKGNAAEAMQYFMDPKKNPDLKLEIGEKPKQGKRNDLESVVKAVKEKCTITELIEDHPMILARYPKFIETVRNAYEEQRDWKTEVIIMWGAPGSGKSLAAFTAGATPVEYENNFFRNYNGEDIIVFDDYEGFEIPRSVLLKICDRYPLAVNIKGGSRNWKPRTIYFTSNTNPKTWSCWDKAFERRVTKIVQLTGTEVLAQK